VVLLLTFKTVAARGVWQALQDDFEFDFYSVNYFAIVFLSELCDRW